ncbi:MAG: DMT family transporter [Acidobacteriota bacterium]
MLALDRARFSPEGGSLILHVPGIGEAAALATALLWAFTAVFFTLAGQRAGAMAVNRTRLLMAVVLLGATHVLQTGALLPFDAPVAAWVWLGLSGLVGLSLGDSFLFRALLDLGPRRAMLVMAAWPIFSSLLALLLLGERLLLREAAGILLTVAGIAWVILEGKRPEDGPDGSRLGVGVAFALGGALCQALGVVLAKEGLRSGMPALSGTLIRMVVAAAGLWTVTPLLKSRGSVSDIFRDGRAMALTAAGAVTGPFLGVWLSLVAVAHAKVGVASALMALVPILILPIVRVVFHERISLRAVLGTAASIAGVLLLTATS